MIGNQGDGLRLSLQTLDLFRARASARQPAAWRGERSMKVCCTQNASAIR